MPKVTESKGLFNIGGILLEREPMWRHTTFLVGGPADIYAVPDGPDDLAELLRTARGENIGVCILGGGSNLLVADAGVRGIVVDMRNLNTVGFDADLFILGSGMNISDAAWKSGSAGRSGLDFLFGMPGTVGGAVWMNARCYDREISECLEWVEILDSDGEVRREPVNTGDWDYKVSPYQEGSKTIIRAAFRVGEDDPVRLRSEMRSRRDDRESKGHYRSPCAGSAFKNNRDFGEPSGRIIDRCGLKGFRIGGACVSPWHGNILINDRGASAADIRRLIGEIARRVEDQTGYRLEPEVLVVGDW